MARFVTLCSRTNVSNHQPDKPCKMGLSDLIFENQKGININITPLMN